MTVARNQHCRPRAVGGGRSTALASTSDHYVLLTPGKEPRFMTVEEVARSFGNPKASPLMRMLRSPGTLQCSPKGKQLRAWAAACTPACPGASLQC